MKINPRRCIGVDLHSYSFLYCVRENGSRPWGGTVAALQSGAVGGVREHAADDSLPYIEERLDLS